LLRYLTGTAVLSGGTVVDTSGGYTTKEYTGSTTVVITV
jgi:hypothetical protein